MFSILENAVGRLLRQYSRISLYYSLLAGNSVRRTVRLRLRPPPDIFRINRLQGEANRHPRIARRFRSILDQHGTGERSPIVKMFQKALDDGKLLK